MIRRSTGITTHVAAGLIQRSQPTLSRIENGTTGIRAVDVEKLLDVYHDAGAEGVTNELRGRLLALLDMGREAEWFTRYRDVIGGDMTGEHVATLISYETFADRMQNFEPELVPGLLQTQDYARAVTDEFFPRHTERDRQRLVELRMDRRHTVERHGSPRIDFVIAAGALRRPFGGAAVLVGQLDSLAEEIRGGTPNFAVRILPGDLTTSAAIGGPFVIITFPDDQDLPVVYLESRIGERYLYDSASVADYQRQLASLVERAYDDSSALELLARTAAEVG